MVPRARLALVLHLARRAHADEPRARLAFVDNAGHRVIFTDIGATTVLDRVDFRDLHLVSALGITGIGSGPDAGAIAIAGQDGSEIVIFRKASSR